MAPIPRHLGSTFAIRMNRRSEGRRVCLFRRDFLNLSSSAGAGRRRREHPFDLDSILPEHGWNPLQRIDRISSIGARFVRRAMLHLRRCRRARKLCRIGLELAQPVARA
jgi:hypothetical protein